MHTCKAIKIKFKKDIGVKCKGTYYLLKLSLSMNLSLSWLGDFSTKKFHQSVSTRRAQLSIAGTTVSSTDLLKCYVKTWVNTD